MQPARSMATAGGVARWALLGVCAACTLLFAFAVLDVSFDLLKPNSPGTRDFVEYWASSRQLLQGANPYDAKALLPLERAVGLPAGEPAMVLGNPPWSLALILPLGLLPAHAAELLWFAALLAALSLSIRLIFRMAQPTSGAVSADPNAAWKQVFGYGFAPALLCLRAGQMSLFVLLGVVLFLRLHRSRPWLAGAALWLCLLKPQILLPWGAVLLLWMLLGRRWRVAAGAAAAVALSSAVTTLIRPGVWTDYAVMMRSARYDRIPIPCFSIALRQGIAPGAEWLQTIPVIVATLAALGLFLYRRQILYRCKANRARRQAGRAGSAQFAWDWLRDGSPVLLISVLAAPYTWSLDQCVVLPALLYAVLRTNSRALLATLGLASTVFEAAWLRGFDPLHSYFYLWSAPAWLLWYVAAVGGGRKASDMSLGREAGLYTAQAGNGPPL